MKRGSGRKQMPEGVRTSSGGLISDQTNSVGYALRKAKNQLFARRIAYLAVGVILLIVMVFLIAGGYISRFIQYWIERAL